MELLLNRIERRCGLRYLVTWGGHTLAADEWLRAEELVHCPERAAWAEYDGCNRRPLARRTRLSPPPPAPPPCPGPTAGIGAQMMSGLFVRVNLFQGFCISGLKTI